MKFSFVADMEKSDKNTVYLHAEVIFDDAQTRKSTMSTAIHNKSKYHKRYDRRKPVSRVSGI